MAGEKSIVSGMAGRYATALFELALEERAVDAVKADLDRFDAMIAENPDLTRLVRSPVFTADEQANAIGKLAEQAGFSPTSTHFLLVVAKNRRLFSVRQMIKDFRLLVARYKGEASAEVTLAEKPSEQHLNAIRAALKGVTDLVDHHEPTHEVFLRNLKKTSDRIAAAAGGFIELVAGS